MADFCFRTGVFEVTHATMFLFLLTTEFPSSNGRFRHIPGLTIDSIFIEQFSPICSHVR